MKTVSGVVVASKPVSLTKAAKILPKFAFSDNGASPAFVAHLKRASDSFQELALLRKELRGSGSDPERKLKRHRSTNLDSSSAQNYAEDVVSVTGEEDGDMETRRKKIKGNKRMKVNADRG